MKLKLKKMDGSTLDVDIDSNAKVLKLKEIISRESGIEVHRQRLIYTGKVLNDEEFLAAYSIADGNVVHLVVRPISAPASPAGAPPVSYPASSTAVHEPMPIPMRFENLGNGVVLGSMSVSTEGAMPSELQQILSQLVSGLQTNQSASGAPAESTSQQAQPQAAPQVTQSSPSPSPSSSSQPPPSHQSSVPVPSPSPSPSRTLNQLFIPHVTPEELQPVPQPSRGDRAAECVSSSNRQTSLSSAPLSAPLLASPGEGLTVSTRYGGALESSLSSIEALVNSTEQSVQPSQLLPDLSTVNTTHHPTAAMATALWEMGISLHSVQLPVLNLYSEMRDLSVYGPSESSAARINLQRRVREVRSMLLHLTQASSDLAEALSHVVINSPPVACDTHTDGYTDSQMNAHVPGDGLVDTQHYEYVDRSHEVTSPLSPAPPPSSPPPELDSYTGGTQSDGPETSHFTPTPTQSRLSLETRRNSSSSVSPQTLASLRSHSQGQGQGGLRAQSRTQSQPYISPTQAPQSQMYMQERCDRDTPPANHPTNPHNTVCPPSPGTGMPGPRTGQPTFSTRRDSASSYMSSLTTSPSSHELTQLLSTLIGGLGIAQGADRGAGLATNVSTESTASSSDRARVESGGTMEMNRVRDMTEVPGTGTGIGTGTGAFQGGHSDGWRTATQASFPFPFPSFVSNISQQDPPSPDSYVSSTTDTSSGDIEVD